MLVTSEIIQGKACCTTAAELFPQFDTDYPDGVELDQLLADCDANAPKHFDWLCRSFAADLPVADYSSFRLASKATLVKYNKALKASVDYDAMDSNQKRLIDVYSK